MIIPIIEYLPDEVKVLYTLAILCLVLVSFIMGYVVCELINEGRTIK